MTIETVQAATAKIANLIADGQYAGAVQACSSSRLTEADVARVMSEYGRTFVRLPANFSDYLDSVLIEGLSRPTWSIRAPLWTIEEGRSDLTLELTVADGIEGLSVELDDLKVM